MSIIVFVLVSALLGFFFINRNNDSNIHDRVDVGEKNIVDLLKNNFDIVDFLEKIIYSSEDEIFVKYEDSKIVFSVNKKIKKIEENQEKLLVLLFEKFNCQSLSLRKEQSGKILRIMLEDITIDKDNVYEQWLIYSTNENENFGNEVLPNWYYKVLFYT